MILIGHSNAGKKPLGQILQSKGLHQSRCLHLDFGERPGQIDAGRARIYLSDADKAYVHSILNGTLFNDEHLPIELSIINSYLMGHSFDHASETPVLNGFPPNPGQAKGLMDAEFCIRAAFRLESSASEAYYCKILAEKGEGHENRCEQNNKADWISKRKILSFEQQTKPILSYFIEKRIPVIRIPVDRYTSPRENVQPTVRETE